MLLKARGYSQREVAARLGISIHTVKNLSDQTHTRLGVNTLVEALRAMGWLRVPPE